MLKGALFQRYSPTDYECFQAFMTMKRRQPGQKPSAMCDALRACLPAHINIEEHDYFFINMFLSLLPPLTQAQCLATKITSITKLSCFADCVHCQEPSLATVAVVRACTTAIRQPPPLPPLDPQLCFYHKRYSAQAQKCKGMGCPKSPPSSKTSGNASWLGGSC